MFRFFLKHIIHKSSKKFLKNRETSRISVFYWDSLHAIWVNIFNMVEERELSRLCLPVAHTCFEVCLYCSRLQHVWNDSQNLNMPRLFELSDNLEDKSLKLNNYKKIYIQEKVY